MGVWSLTHSIAMFVLGTFELVANAYTVFQYNRRDLVMADVFKQNPLWKGLHAGATTSLVISICLQDSILVREVSKRLFEKDSDGTNGVQIYRALVIWSFNYLMMIASVVVFIASIGMSLVIQKCKWPYFIFARSGSSIAAIYFIHSGSKLATRFSPPFFILTVVLNAALTAAIIGRLYFLRNQILEFGKQHGRFYSNLTAMFFESGALYTMVGIIYLATLLSKNVAQELIIQPFEQSVVSLCTSTFYM
jgi:hypothetical protein